MCSLNLNPPLAEKNEPLRIGVILFPGFQALDVFGPLDALNILSRSQNLITLALLSSTLEPVTTKPTGLPNAIGQFILPTHTFASAPPLDVLLVPGGQGTRNATPAVEEVIAYIRDVYPQLKFLLTVCTGAGLAARAGVLDGKRATTNKHAWATVTPLGPNVQWLPQARWVVDGNVWTSSGVSAGIDLTLAWIATLFGEDVAQGIADGMEYERHKDPNWDPFAALYGLH
jgi:transcriptional regulator GlxA family with amidase domain